MSRELMGGTWNKEYIQKMEEERALRKYRESKWKDVKLALKVCAVVGVAASFVTVSVIGVNKMVKNASDNDDIKKEEPKISKEAEKVNDYQKQKYLTNDEFYLKLQFEDGCVERLSDYVTVSIDLHKLDLDQYPEITYFDDAVTWDKWKNKDDVEKEIEDFKNNKATIKDVVGDEAITFNHQIYELREIEKMYNEKVYEGYAHLEAYSMLSAQSYLSDIYGGKPEQYDIKYKEHYNDYPEITGPGIHYGDGFNGNILEYVGVLGDVYKAENAPSGIAPDEFNGDRNTFILKACTLLDNYGYNIIKYDEKLKKIELEESQERTEKYFESFGKSK